MPASRSLRISVDWFSRDGGLRARVTDRRSGQDQEGLPADAARFDGRLSSWAELAGEHYVWVDQVDIAQGWRDEDVRRAFVAEALELQSDLRHALRNGWIVEVSPEPGVADVRLMGEYGAHWPLWVADGGTGPENWPMLSASMVDRLEGWAVLADPAHYPGPDDALTELLRRDLARELGERFRVRT